MFKVIRDLLQYDGRFRIAFILLLAVVVMILLSFVSPYEPNISFQVPMDAPPSLDHFFGTDSRGKDIFWWMTFGVRNSLIMGVITAVISRVIAILVGLAAGYQGGWLDRVLMSVNDSFVVLPLLPILILLGFLLRDMMNLFLLGVILGFFGWPYDARLIRSQVLSLKERSFTRTAVYSSEPHSSGPISTGHWWRGSGGGSLHRLWWRPFCFSAFICSSQASMSTLIHELACA
jgi:peptide/nickel transport system permease protein